MVHAVISLHEVPVVNERNHLLIFYPISLVEYVCICFWQVTLVKMVNEATANIPNWGS